MTYDPPTHSTSSTNLYGTLAFIKALGTTNGSMLGILAMLAPFFNASRMRLLALFAAHAYFAPTYFAKFYSNSLTILSWRRLENIVVLIS